MAGLPIHEAARELGVSVPTLRRWVAQGAPTVRAGWVGRGNGSRVHVEAVRQWHATRHVREVTPGEFIARLETVLVDFHRGGDHRRMGWRDSAAAAYLDALHQYLLERFDVQTGRLFPLLLRNLSEREQTEMIDQFCSLDEDDDEAGDIVATEVADDDLEDDWNEE
jgi:hypothetical protein